MRRLFRVLRGWPRLSELFAKAFTTGGFRPPADILLLAQKSMQKRAFSSRTEGTAALDRHCRLDEVLLLWDTEGLILCGPRLLLRSAGARSPKHSCRSLSVLKPGGEAVFFRSLFPYLPKQHPRAATHQALGSPLAAKHQSIFNVLRNEQLTCPPQEKAFLHTFAAGQKYVGWRDETRRF